MSDCKHVGCVRPAGHFADGQLCRGHARMLGVPPDHGVRSRRVWHGCGCAACVATDRAYQAEHRETVKRLRPRPGDMVDGEPAAAMVRVLLAAGWSERRITARSGLGHGTVGRLARGESGRVRRATVDALRRVYESAHSRKDVAA